MTFCPFHVLGENHTVSHFSQNLVHRGRGSTMGGQRPGIGIPDGLPYSAGEEARGGGGRNFPVQLADARPHSNVNCNFAPPPAISPLKSV